MKMLYKDVEVYDPTEEIMVVVSVSSSKKVYPFHLSQKPYPPEAFQMRKDVFKKASN
jgi:hypothetical protein